MAVCNIFKTLTKETGTFLTFSQYMEDLTAGQTMAKYHNIVPSKFIAIDCKNTLLDIAFPKRLTEHFENACAYFKNMSDLTWTPEYSKTLFWNTMFDIITIEDIKYVGDINLQSYNDVDGMGYSEIYCHIPNEAAAYKYNVVTNNNVSITTPYTIKPTDKDGNVITLEGFKVGDLGGGEQISTEYTYTLNRTYEFSWDKSNSSTEKLGDKSFNINMIVVLYDIWNDNKISCSGIPMGIYVTGLIDNDGKIQNSITKYVANEDIYNSGTSYGLRICSRYVVAPDQDKCTTPEVSCEDNNYGDLTRVLSQLSISQNKMDDIVNHKYIEDQKYKELYSIFTSSKTNVPYVKTVNGKDYWFVNGKMIDSNFGQSISSVNNNKEIEKESDLILHTSILPNTSQNVKYGLKKLIFDATKAVENVYIYWKAEDQGQTLSTVDNIQLLEDGKIIKYENNSNSNNYYTIGLSGGINHKYQIKCGYNGKVAISSELDVKFVYPTYFGHSSEDLWKETILTTNGSNPDLTDLKRLLLDSREQAYIVPSQTKELHHLYLLYPKDYGELTSITDEESYNYLTTDFSMKTLTINGINYLLYYDEKGAVSANKIIYFK